MEKAEERRQALRPDYLQLVLLVRSQVAEGQSCLALYLGGRRIHEIDQGLHQPWLGLGQLPTVVGVNCDVAQRRRAVVLNVNIRRRQELDQDRNSPGVDELLSVFICGMLAGHLPVSNGLAYPNVSC